MTIVIGLFLLVSYQVCFALLEPNSPGRPLLTERAGQVLEAGTVHSEAISVKWTDSSSPLQSEGHFGYPGLKIRVNRNAFRYVSSLISQMLNQGVPKIQIPPFSQCLPEVNGCAHLSNIMIRHYQSSRRVNLSPVPYNRIVLAIEGIAISVSVQMTVERNYYSRGARLRVGKCIVNIGYLNVYIVNGGLIGDLINSNFRSKIIAQTRAMLPGKICGMLPSLVDDKVNSQLAGLPQAIPIMKMVSYVSVLTAKPRRLPQHCYTDVCRRYRAMNTTSVRVLKTKANLLAGTPNLSNTRPSDRNDNERFNGTLLDIGGSRQGKKSTTFGRHKGFHVKTKSIRLKASPELNRQVRAVNASRHWLQCAGCDNTEEKVVSHFTNVVISRIRMRASDLALSTYLLGTYATNFDFTLSLSGEFSPGARTGSTPFGPPVLHYPNLYGARMLDLLISDYTVNTLLYQLHRKGVFAFRIGPELPTIGDLFNTTCTDTDFYVDLSTEIQDIRDSGKPVNFYNRRKRQDGVEALRNFGVCFGDIAPEIREKNPDKRIYIMVKTARAPSVLFKAASGGTTVIEFVVDGFIYLDGTNTKVGRIQIETTFTLTTQLVGSQIFGSAQIERLKFVDVEKTFGLQQDAFDNLADLARGTILRVVNSKLTRGTQLPVPPLSIPIDLHNIYMQVIEHSLLISTDIHIQPSLLWLPSRIFR